MNEGAFILVEGDHLEVVGSQESARVIDLNAFAVLAVDEQRALVPTVPPEVRARLAMRAKGFSSAEKIVAYLERKRALALQREKGARGPRNGHSSLQRSWAHVAVELSEILGNIWDDTLSVDTDHFDSFTAFERVRNE